jgi:hypothetical protein
MRRRKQLNRVTRHKRSTHERPHEAVRSGEVTGEVTGEEEKRVCLLVFRISAVGLPSAPFVMASGLGSGVDGWSEMAED